MKEKRKDGTYFPASCLSFYTRANHKHCCFSPEALGDFNKLVVAPLSLPDKWLLTLVGTSPLLSHLHIFNYLAFQQSQAGRYHSENWNDDVCFHSLDNGSDKGLGRYSYTQVLK